MDINKFQYLFEHPKDFKNEYERGIVHGMAFFAEKLIWAEELYLNALESNHKDDKKYNYNNHIDADMHKIVNRIYQDFAHRSCSFDLFKSKELESWYNNIRKELGLEIYADWFEGKKKENI